MAKTQTQQHLAKVIEDIITTAKLIQQQNFQGKDPNVPELVKLQRLAESLNQDRNRYEHARRKPEMSVIISNQQTATLMHTVRRFDGVHGLIMQSRMRSSYPAQRLIDVESSLSAALTAFDAAVSKGRKLVRNAKVPNRPKSKKQISPEIESKSDSLVTAKPIEKTEESTSGVPKAAVKKSAAKKKTAAKKTSAKTVAKTVSETTSASATA